MGVNTPPTAPDPTVVVVATNLASNSPAMIGMVNPTWLCRISLVAL